MIALCVFLENKVLTREADDDESKKRSKKIRYKLRQKNARCCGCLLCCGCCLPSSWRWWLKLLVWFMVFVVITSLLITLMQCSYEDDAVSWCYRSKSHSSSSSSSSNDDVSQMIQTESDDNTTQQQQRYNITATTLSLINVSTTQEPDTVVFNTAKSFAIGMQFCFVLRTLYDS